MNSPKNLKKRDGRIVPFQPGKIKNAIFAAFHANNKSVNEESVSLMVGRVVDGLAEMDASTPTVEQVQDLVENALMEFGYEDIAKHYILYRAERSRSREMNSRLMKTYEDITFSSAADSDLKRENANVNGDTAMGTMLKYGSEGSKQFYQMFVLKPEHAKAHQDGDIHIHDMDFAPMGTTTCTQIDLLTLFDGGFSTGHGMLREPNDIASYSALGCIAIQSNQNDQHGGQSVTNFDYAMAEGVKKTFARLYRQNLAKAILLEHPDTDISKNLKEWTKEIKQKENLFPNLKNSEAYFKEEERFLWAATGIPAPEIKKFQTFAFEQAKQETDRATYQAMEAFIHNLNTMHCLPASERIWVWDRKNERYDLMRMDDLDKLFENGRFEVPSLNRETGATEWKLVVASAKKDNNRELATIYTENGQKVTVTTNHKVMTEIECEITEDIPENIEYVLMPEFFKRTAMLCHKINHKKSILGNEGDMDALFEDYKPTKVERINTTNSGEEYVYDISVADNENFLTEDGIFVHNSRAGAQTPFSSINYGMDTSPEGRMVMKNLLLATEAGLGDGETPIFPIQVFRVKEGVNYNPGDPNYDLFRLAIRCSAKRLFPNFVFLDAPFNLQYYKEGHPETEVASMGCRTRVIGNINDPTREISNGRGNLSFTTINLPRLGIEAHGDLDKFFQLLDKKLNLAVDQLLERFEFQCRKKVRNFPFLMGQGVWMDSENLGPDDELREVLKHGTLSVGFIGLAETLVALMGKHHGEDEKAQETGLKIISHMRERMDKEMQERKLNFSLLATPSEGTAGRYVKLDKKRYGILPGITDREYYTNSFHVPVYYNISAYDKIAIEAPYHALTNAGHISYIEMDGDPTKNLEAFEKVIRCMKESGIGYGSVNHPVDRDPVCGFSGIIYDRCPGCGREQGDVPFERIRRITGYLVGTLDRFNNAKRAEEHDRVKHET